MPRIASFTSSKITGIVANIPAPVITPTYNSLTLDGTAYNEGATIIATLNTANIPNGTTVGYTVTGMSFGDLVSGATTGTFTVNSNIAFREFVLNNDGLTEGPDTFTITLATTDSAGNTTGSLSDSATINDTSNDPASSLWVDDNGNPVTIRTIIGANSLQLNGVFAANPSVPRTIEGRTSAAQTTITAVTARTGTFIELDDTGNSTSFIVGESLNLVTISYSVAPAANNINEGSSLTFTVTTTNLPNGITLYWTVNRPEDFAVSSGSFTINNSTGTFTVTPTADATTESSETFTASVRTGSTSGTVVATSSSVTINDTSQLLADVIPTTAMPSPQNLTDWDTVNRSLITYSILNTQEFFVSQGTSWVSRTLPLPYPSNAQSIRYYNGFVYAVVTPGSPTFSRDIYRSTDYQTWNLVFSTGINSRWRIDINETTGRFLATSGGTANAVISSNGSSWTAISLPAAAIDLGFGNKGWNGNTVIAANWGSLTDHLYRSTDNGANWSSVANSTTWSSVPENSRRYAQSVANNGSRFIALIGQGNRRMSISTDDGVTWTTPEVNIQWNGLANNIFFSRVKNKFIVTNAGDANITTVSYSTDGAVGNWSTTSTLPANVSYIVESATRVYGAATNGSVVDLTDLI